MDSGEEGNEIEPTDPEESNRCGEDLTWEIVESGDDKGTLIIKGTGSMYDYGWDEDYEHKTAQPWENQAEEILAIRIEPGVTSIGKSAFEDLSQLASVEIAESVEKIGENAFYRCEELQEVLLPANVTAIGRYAFDQCRGLKHVAISEKVSSIGDAAFLYCSSLEIITVEEGNETYAVQNGALVNKKTKTLIVCPNKYQSKETICTIPEGIERIENFAFYGCSHLTEVKISAGVTSIGDEAFRECENLTFIEIPSTVQTIGYNPFQECVSLEKIKVEEGNQNYYDVDGVLFRKCVGEDGETSNWLMSCPGGYSNDVYNVPEGVYGFDQDAFSCCLNLKSVNISAGVADIPFNAFSGCRNLEAISVDKDNQTYFSADGVLFKNAEDGRKELTRYPYNRKGDYIVPEGTTSIADSAFDRNYNLTKVWLPESLTQIGIWAFEQCVKLDSVEIGKNLTYIGDYAFNLKDIYYGGNEEQWNGLIANSGLTPVNEDAVVHYNSTMPTETPSPSPSVTPSPTSATQTDPTITTTVAVTQTPIPSATETPIPTQTQEPTNAPTGTPAPTDTSTPVPTQTETPAVTPTKAPETTTPPSVDTQLKDDKTNATYQVTVPGSAVSYAEPDDKKATSVTVPSKVKINGITYTVTSIGDWAFRNNRKLKKVTIPSKVDTIGTGAFQGCTSLGSITIGKNVNTVGSKAFKGCTALTSVKISAKAGKIGKQAFYNCKKLKKIVISDKKLTAKKIGANAFKNAGKENYKALVVKVPAGKAKAYRKILLKKGLSPKAAVK